MSVVEAVSEEVSVGLALRQFRDAVHGFAEESVVWDGTAARRIPALYLRVRAAMSRQSASGGAGVHQSRLPCGIDPLDWCRQVDAEVGRWCGGGTLYALRDLAGRTYGTDQSGVLVARTARLQQWARSAAELLGDVQRPVPIRQKCPNCSQFWHYSAGGVRQFALIVTEDAARCLSCQSVWDQSRFGILARMLGVDTAIV